MRDSKQRILFMFVIAFLTIVAYSPSLKGDFIWDDRPLILKDSQIRSFANIGRIFSRDFFAPGLDDYEYGYYRPVITLSYMIDRAFFGENPTGFRLMNLFWHLLAAFLLYRLLLALFPKHDFLCMATTAIFALHPMHVEAVAWISGRTDLICSVFSLVSALLWYKYLQQNPLLVVPAKTKEKSKKVKNIDLNRKSLWVLFAAYFSLLVSLLSKEMGIVTPCLIIALAWLSLPENKVRGFRKLRWELGGFFVVVVIYLILRKVVGGVSASDPSAEHSILKALTTFPAAFAFYCQKLLAPINTAAYIVWPYQSHPFSFYGISGLLLLASLLFVAFRKIISAPALAMTSFVFLASFGPLANIIRISGPTDMGFVMAERFLYIPSIFACLLVGAFCSRWLSATKNKFSEKIVIAIFCVASLGFGIKTAHAAELWKNEALVYENALRHYPTAPLLWANLGAHYRRRGDIDLALNALRKAESINERLQSADPVAIYNNLGTALASAGRLPEALEYFDKAIDSGHQADQIHFNRGEALRLMGRAPEALRAYDKSLAINNAEVHPHLRRGQVRLALGEIDGALEDLNFVLSAEAENAEAMASLGIAWRNKGNLAKSRIFLNKAVSRGANNFQTWMALGGVEGQQGNFPKAAKAFERALKISPESIEALTALAAAQFRSGQKDAAKKLLNEALAKDPDNIEILIHLMHWHYEVGDNASLTELIRLATKIAPDHPVVMKYKAALEKSP